MADLRQRRGEEGQDYTSNEGEETSRLVSIHLTSLQGEENKLQTTYTFKYIYYKFTFFLRVHIHDAVGLIHRCPIKE